MFSEGDARRRCAAPIWLVAEDLGAHVVWCSDHRFGELESSIEHSRDAKIAELDVVLLCEEDIL